jgi:hypothetical protein
MTLILMGINERGVWQCSDRRVTLRKSGRETVLDDDSIKHVDLRFPDGSALLAYAGLAYLGTQHVSEWVVETLIGKQFSIVEALEKIRDRATADIGSRVHHDFLLGGFQNGMPWAARITNGAPRSDYLCVPPLGSFEMGGCGITSPMVFFAGASRAVVPDDVKKVEQAVAANSAQKDLRRLLASVNRRAARAKHPHARYISEGCVSVSLDRNGGTSYQIFHWKGFPERQPAIPSVWFGADTTTPDTAIPGLRRALLKMTFKTPEAEAEYERVAGEWEQALLAETGEHPRRLQPPKEH